MRLVEEAEDLEPGEVALEAQLKPNDRLLYLNDQGQKLFTSIEITPDFRGKGKTAQYFFANILPTVTQHAQAIEETKKAFLKLYE